MVTYMGQMKMFTLAVYYAKLLERSGHIKVKLQKVLELFSVFKFLYLVDAQMVPFWWKGFLVWDMDN